MDKMPLPVFNKEYVPGLNQSPNGRAESCGRPGCHSLDSNPLLSLLGHIQEVYHGIPKLTLEVIIIIWEYCSMAESLCALLGLHLGGTLAERRQSESLH
jgi:hypothetical protein